MRKLLIVCLCCALLLCPITHAEGVFNIDDYTPEQLEEIYGQVSEKLFDCIIAKQGIYVVGEDLPVGRYAIMKHGDLPDDAEFCHMAIFSSMEDYKQDSKRGSFFDDDSSAIDACNTLWGGTTQNLTEGMVIVVAFGDCGIRKVNSSIFSAFWN